MKNLEDMEKKIALISHDEKKEDMVRFATSHRKVLSRQRLIATGTTGEILRERVGLPISRVESGPKGGDLQIGGKIVSGEIKAVIFLRDPLTAHPHDPDIEALLKICDVHNVPLATNVSTADMIMFYLKREVLPVTVAREIE